MVDSHSFFPIAALWILLGTLFFITPVQAQIHHYYPTVADRDLACVAGSNTMSSGWVGWTGDVVPPAFSYCPPRAACYHYVDASPGVQHHYHHLQDCGSACPTGWSPDPITQECIEDVPVQACPVEDEQRFHGDAGEPIPENVCSNGCWYEAKYDDVPVTFHMGTHAWSGNFISTGNACEVGGGPGGPPDNPPTNCISDSYGNTFCTRIGPGNAPPNCMEAGGNQACLDAYDPMNCGYINGEPVCFDDYPDEGICEFLPGGSYICFSGDEAPQSPPYPDTGTPGEPATPDVQMQKGDGQGGPGYSLDYFNSDTIDQSSGEGGAPGPNSDKSTPDKLEIDGPVEVELNEPVQIDEEGTPQQSATDQTIFDDIFNQTGINALESEIADIGAGTVSPIPSVPSTLSDIDELFPTPQSCADPELNFFGATMTIPFASMGQGLRDVLGWAFYIMTGLYLFGLVMSLPAKVK